MIGRIAHISVVRFVTGEELAPAVVSAAISYTNK